MIELKLNWFDDEEETVEPINVPDIPGVGGVLTAFVETLEDESVVLRATFKEVSLAVNKGWIVAIFDGAGKCSIVTEASVDDSGEVLLYVIKDSAGAEYAATSPDVQPELQAAEDDEEQGGGGESA